MKDRDMLWNFSPKGLKDIFEVVNVKNGSMTFDVWLDEKREKSDEDKYNNQIIGHGFTSYKVIQDHLTRGKPMHLHMRRCKWLNKETGEIFSYDIDYYNEDGTCLSADFRCFFKRE